MKASVAGESLLMAALNACRSRLKAFIRGRTAVRDDADDILQEVTYQLMQVEQPVENVAAWLFRAARNEMTDRARKNGNCRYPVFSPMMREMLPKMNWRKRCSVCRKPRKRNT